jgi:hypothetical protein
LKRSLSSKENLMATKKGGSKGGSKGGGSKGGSKGGGSKGGSKGGGKGTTGGFGTAFRKSSR